MSNAQHHKETLEGRGIKVHFAGIKAVDGIDVAVERGQVMGLIGPNGAGKTTLLNALSGFERPTAGAVYLGDTEITGKQPHIIARMGLVHTFQDIRIFGELSVFENIELGALGVGMRRAEARALTWQLLTDSRLTNRAQATANELPHGEERRVGMLRAVAMQPRFLLLDEPAAGLNDAEAHELVDFLDGLSQRFGFGLVVIEHNMQVIMRLCKWIKVIDYGRTIATGTPAEVQNDPVVQAAYLGTMAKEDTAGRRGDL